MEVTQLVTTVGIEVWNWTAALDKSHLIALAVSYAVGYWARGRKHV